MGDCVPLLRVAYLAITILNTALSKYRCLALDCTNATTPIPDSNKHPKPPLRLAHRDPSSLPSPPRTQTIGVWYMDFFALLRERKQSTFAQSL